MTVMFVIDDCILLLQSLFSFKTPFLTTTCHSLPFLVSSSMSALRKSSTSFFNFLFSCSNWLASCYREQKHITVNSNTVTTSVVNTNITSYTHAHEFTPTHTCTCAHAHTHKHTLLTLTLQILWGTLLKIMSITLHVQLCTVSSCQYTILDHFTSTSIIPHCNHEYILLVELHQPLET